MLVTLFLSFFGIAKSVLESVEKNVFVVLLSDGILEERKREENKHLGEGVEYRRKIFPLDR